MTHPHESPGLIVNPSRTTRRRLQGWVAGALLAGGLAGGPALAATNNWVHTTGSLSWFAPANWSPDVPTPDDAAFIGNNTTAFVEGPTAATAAHLFIDSGGVTIGNIDSGTLTVSGEVGVGTSGGAGRLTLNFGTVSLNTLSVGVSGIYTDTTFTTLNLTGVDPTIKMANGVNVVVNSEITGGNGLIKGGLGTLTLANNNTYTGGTTISAGTLQLGNGGTTGSLGEGDVSNNGTLIFNRSDSLTVANLISGSGAVRQNGPGTLMLTADNTYGGGTIISGGTLQVGDGGTAGALGSGNVTNNATLVFNRSDDLTVGNLISGTGSLRQSGSNTLTVTADNTYTGSTTIATNATLQVGNGGAAGALGTGSIANQGVLIYNRSDDLVVSNLVSGVGAFTHAGDGQVTLVANNTYSGVTTISAGTLQVGDGGTTGAIGTNQIVNHGALIINRSDSLVVNNEISGTGSFTHAGTNALTLTATNTYAGGTWVQNGGTLFLRNGQVLGSGDLHLNHGTLRAVTSLTNTLQMDVGGDYTQGADSTLGLRVGGTEAGEYDQLNITGTADLDGTLHVTRFNNYLPRHNDELALVVAEGGVTGTFAEFTNNIPHSPLLLPGLIYNPTNVTLKWEHLSFVDYLTSSNDVSLTSNQRAVAQGLDSLLGSSDTNDLALIDRLDYLPSLTNNLPIAFDLIAPEELTAMSVAAVAAMDAQGQQFLRRANDLRADYRSFYSAALRAKATSPDVFDAYVDRPWEVYFSASGDFVDVSGDANAAGLDMTRASFSVGADHYLRHDLVVGLAVGYGHVGADLVRGGSLDMDSVQGQFYGMWFKDGLHFEGMIGGALNSLDSSRVGLDGNASGSTDGTAWTGLFGGGYDWQNGPWTIGPQAAVQYVSSSADSFTEKGSLAPLRISEQTAESLFAQLGVNVRYRVLVREPWTVVTPEVYLGWRHEVLDDDLSVTSRFASGNGDSFTVRGAQLGSDSVVASLGVTVQWTPAAATWFNYTAQFGSDGYDIQSLNAGLRICF